MFKRTFLAIAVGAFLSSGLVQAAPQFGSSPAQAQSSTQAPAAHAAPAATKTNDALINQIAANGAKDQQAVKVLSAKERADSFLAAQVERGVLEAGPGWNEEQQVYIAIGTAVVPMDSIKNKFRDTDSLTVSPFLNCGSHTFPPLALYILSIY